MRSHFSSTTQPAAHAACLSWFGSAMPHIHGLDLGSGRNVCRALEGRALTQRCLTAAGLRSAAFKISGSSPHDSRHGLYRTLIHAHGERVRPSQKPCFTRKYGHVISLLIMDRFQSVARRFESYLGAQTWLDPG